MLGTFVVFVRVESVSKSSFSHLKSVRKAHHFSLSKPLILIVDDALLVVVEYPEDSPGGDAGVDVRGTVEGVENRDVF